jgi:HSP20 family protein
MIGNLVPWARSRSGVSASREPQDLFTELQREMNGIFDNMWRGFGTPAVTGDGGTSRLLQPTTDIAETDKEYEVTVELPGIDEKDVEVTLANGVLSIKGEKKFEREEKKKDYYLSERSFGSFQRSIRVPEDVDGEKVSAAFAKGVLTLKLPKLSEAQSTTKKIAVKAG